MRRAWRIELAEPEICGHQRLRARGCHSADAVRFLVQSAYDVDLVQAAARRNQNALGKRVYQAAPFPLFEESATADRTSPAAA
jgi:hypothetical protein